MQGKNYTFGTFLDPVDAARCYNKEATKLHGAAAILNILPRSSTCPTIEGVHPCNPGTMAIPGPTIETSTCPTIDCVHPSNPEIMDIPGPTLETLGDSGGPKVCLIFWGVSPQDW